ncbi:glycoside hydrolase family 43 protein [Sabulibacter ruber]|uniref:glycoside hydrolase family 43 protein n=1 Tax=Sabulibacter ruber TaxID=2811901 RepID=UPI001A9779E4|nr:glycoside hydrolase family 43 protein [Sabulibacter ruber]
MKIPFKVISWMWVLCLITFFARAQNPIIQTIYTADPAPLVHRDRVYLYTGHDEDTATYFRMNDWRVYSSADMVNWTDHGSPLSFETFKWASGDAWASHCISRNGKFYWYVTATDKTLKRPVIGVAVSDSPTGPFKDAIGKPLITNQWGDIDPTAFIDEDGQAYLYWGNPKLWYVKLNQDMVSYDQKVGVVEVPLTKESFAVRPNNTQRTTSYEEGPWLDKRGSLYYLLYAAGGVPEHLAYSTSTSPTGPWVYRDTIMTVIKKGGAFTNHPGLVDFKGKSYLFYHNGALPNGGGFRRSVAVEEFSFNPDGTIPRILPTKEGVTTSAAFLNPFQKTEAETGAWMQGVETKTQGNTGVYVTDIQEGDYIKVRSVDFGAGAKSFQASVAAGGTGGRIEVRLDSPSGQLVGTCPVKSTGGELKWKTAAGKIKGATGVKDLYLVFKGGQGALFNFDWWRFASK